jgi:hypothetical protein
VAQRSVAATHSGHVAPVQIWRRQTVVSVPVWKTGCQALLGVTTIYRCRHCNEAIYSSERKGPKGCFYLKARRIRFRLGEDSHPGIDALPPRPWRTHRKTYCSLIAGSLIRADARLFRGVYGEEESAFVQGTDMLEVKGERQRNAGGSGREEGRGAGRAEFFLTFAQPRACLFCDLLASPPREH